MTAKGIVATTRSFSPSFLFVIVKHARVPSGHWKRAVRRHESSRVISYLPGHLPQFLRVSVGHYID